MSEQTRRWYSSWDVEVTSEEETQKLWKIELRDMARGFCGALFLALPLLYTMEMWERARVVPSWDMAIIVTLAYFGNVGFALFNSFKPDLKRQAAWLDALTAMGIGLVASGITLLLIGRYSLNTPPEIMVKLLLLEMVPASFGASLAINQLGSRNDKSGDKVELRKKYSVTFRKIMGTLLGATMFAFNVAPTLEPQMVTYSASPWHTLSILLFSLLVSYVMVSFANFCERDGGRGLLHAPWVETVVSYLISLAVSGGLLWMFGYLDLNTSFGVMISWIITMGYATTLGGSAGRLVL